MLGVLLQRSPALRESASDINPGVINWWRTVRDRPGELGEMLDWTPGWSPVLFEEAVAGLEAEDEVLRAYNFTLTAAWSRGGVWTGAAAAAAADAKAERDGESRVRNMITRKRIARDGLRETSPGGEGTRMEMSPPRSRHIKLLSERVSNVEFHCMDGAALLELEDSEDMVFYIDPPYPSSAPRHRLYADTEIDIDRWVELLTQISGRAAISGYPGEWSLLEEAGWEVRTLNTHGITGSQSEGKRPSRTEALWINYHPPQAGLW